MPASRFPRRGRARAGRHRAERAGITTRVLGAARRLPSSAVVAATVLALAGAGVGVVVVGPSAPDGAAGTLRTVDAAGTWLRMPSLALAAETGARDPRRDQTSRSQLTADRREAVSRVSRSHSRDNLQQQAELRARQRVDALQQLASAVQDRARELAAERESEQWVLPLAGYSISAGFGDAGYLWSSGYHTGLDLSAPEGRPIVAVTSGVITSTGYTAEAGWAGNHVVQRLADGTEIWYAHQSSVAVDVGETVDPGQLVGYVGSTGNSTGPHLHLEVQVDGEPVDPAQLLTEHDLTP